MGACCLRSLLASWHSRHFGLAVDGSSTILRYVYFYIISDLYLMHTYCCHDEVNSLLPLAFGLDLPSFSGVNTAGFGS